MTQRSMGCGAAKFAAELSMRNTTIPHAGVLCGDPVPRPGEAESR